ncbi:MAG: FAD-binding protein [Firmicutes bacterium]|nr:FAD-binding protein [Bacillota bacterium]MDY6159805.1 FAD-binding protein [Candidatus Faecousia sp.]
MGNNNFTRRDFLKGAAAGAFGLATAGILGSLGKASAEGIYTPGTYTATAQGMGTVKMTAVFDANSIVSIDLDLAEETPAIGQAAKDAIIEQLLGAQGTDIDGVSSATITTNAAKSCLEQCIAQAKGGAAIVNSNVEQVLATEGTFVATDIIPEDVNASAVVMGQIKDFAQEIDCDIVVCGAGAAGVVAAVKALDEGKKVVVLQKEPIADSQGNCASAIVKSGSTPGGLASWKNMCIATNAWRSDPRLIDAYIENSEDALRFLCEKGGVEGKLGDKNEKTGVEVYQSSDTVFTGVRVDGTQSWDFGEDKVEIFAPWFGPKPNNFGTLVSGILNDAAEQYGDMLDVHYSTPVVQLIQKDGAVVGCIGKDASGAFVKVNAKAVILATGAYENNPTMVRRFCPDTEAFDKKVYHRTGDGNILAVLAGGVMEPVAHSTVMHDFDAGLMWDNPYLFLNMEGKRFTNETVEMAYISKQLRWQPSFKGENMDHEHQETGSKGWYCQIYDNDYMNYVDMPMLVPPVAMKKYMKEGPAEDHVGVFPHLIDTFCADTLEELVEKLGLPKEEALASIERYNQLCDEGYDPDFGKNPKFLNKIQTAPFWGIRRHIRCSSITAGVLTDANSMVVREDGTPVQGLYAVGNLGGQFFGGCDYPFFSPGLSLGHAVTFGYIAAKHAASL